MLKFLQKVKRHYLKNYKAQFNWLSVMLSFDDDEILKIPKDSIDYIIVDGMKYRFNNCSEGIIRQNSELLNNIKHDDIALDIGAGLGDWTIPLSLKCKQVYAIEPIYTKELQENIDINAIKNIHFQRKALSSVNNAEQAVAFQGKNCLSSTITFDFLLKWCSHVDFLRCDCEGGEWDIRPEQCKNIREMRFEFHIPRDKRQEHCYVKYYNWLQWFSTNHYQITVEKNKLQSTIDFKELYNVSASKQE
jgi:FkbM family methyltransferase